MARKWFKKTTFEVYCEGTLHSLTLLPSGHLRMNDHSEKTVRAFLAFDAPKPECLEIQEAYYAGSSRFSLPLQQEVNRVRNVLIDAALAALKGSSYRRPSIKWCRRAKATYSVEVTHPPGKSSLTSDIQTVWDKRGYPGKKHELTLRLSLPDYIEVLKLIPSGLAYTRDGKAILVVRITQVNRVKRQMTSLHAIVGRQGRGLDVYEAEALLVKDEDGDWVVKKWL